MSNRRLAAIGLRGGEIQDMLRGAGFVDVRVNVVEASREVIHDWVAGDSVSAKVASATIEARRPENPTLA